MKTAITIHLAGRLFTIDEDAHKQLEQYLHELRNYFAADATEEEAKEIIDDIENRIAEILTERLGDKQVAVTQDDVTFVLKEMGTVDAIAKEGRTTEPEQPETEPTKEAWRPGRKLYRDSDNEVIGGVCAGLAAYFDVDVTFIRIAFLLLMLVNGLGVILYIVLWIAMPEAVTATEKAAMRGKRANISNIEKAVKERLAKGLTEEDRARARTGLQRFYDAAREVFQGLGRVILVLLKVLAGVLAMVMTIGGLLLIAVATAAFVQLLVGGEDGWVITPITNLVNATSGINLAFLISVYVTVVLVGLFLMLIANQMMRKGRNPFAWVSTVVFALIFIAGFVAINLGLRIAPDLQERYQEYAQVVVEERVITELDTFTGVDVNGSTELYVSYAAEPSVKLIGDQRILDTHELIVADGVLQLRDTEWFNVCFIWCHLTTTKLFVATPSLNSVTMSGASYAEIGALPAGTEFALDASGSSDAILELAADQLLLDLSGASELIVNGFAKQIDAELSGASKLDGINFSTQQAELDLSGASEAVLQVSDALTASASGASHIEYIGTPIVDEDTSGSSTVQQYSRD